MSNSIEVFRIFGLSNETQKQLPDVFCKKCFLINVAKFTENSPVSKSLINSGPRVTTLLQKRIWYSCFPVNFVKILRKHFFIEQLRVLLLETMVLRMKRILTLSWRKPLSYRNQSTDLQSKSIDWFLYNNDLRHERVNNIGLRIPALSSTKSVNASTSCPNLLQNTFINTRENRYNRLSFRDIKTTVKNTNHMTLKVLATNPHN